MGDADRPRAGQAPDIGPSKQHRAGPQAERLEHIAAIADAAIEQNRNPPRHPRQDLRQCVEAGRRAIEDATAVIRHHQPVATQPDRVFGVIGMQDALEDQRLTKLVAQPGQVVPGRRPRHPAIEYRAAVWRWRVCRQRSFQVDRLNGAGELQRGQFHRRIDSQHQHWIARRFGAPRQAQGGSALALPIKLEPGRVAGLPTGIGDAFQRLAGQTADPESAALGRGGHRAGAFAIGMKQSLIGNRRQHDRMRQCLTEQVQAGMAAAHIDQRTRQQACRFERPSIGGQRQSLAAAILQIAPGDRVEPGGGMGFIVAGRFDSGRQAVQARFRHEKNQRAARSWREKPRPGGWLTKEIANKKRPDRSVVPGGS